MDTNIAIGVCKYVGRLITMATTSQKINWYLLYVLHLYKVTDFYTNKLDMLPVLKVTQVGGKMEQFSHMECGSSV